MSTSDWLGLAGVLIGVVGIALAIHFARRSRAKPILRIATDTDEMLAPEDWLLSGGLKLMFRGKEIEQISRTYVAVWNGRGDTIRGEDVVTPGGLQLTLNAADTVLSARIVAESKPDIGATVAIGADGVSAGLQFGFLDEGDGFVVEILHKLTIGPAFAGVVRGASQSPPAEARLDFRSRERIRASFARRYWGTDRVIQRAGELIVVLAFFLGLGLAASSQLFSDELINPFTRSAMLVGGILYSLTSLAGLVLKAVRVARTSIPRSVVFEDYQLDSQSEVLQSLLTTVTLDGSPLGTASVGQKIRHQEFGTGIVREIAGEGSKTIISVDFAKLGRKRLLLAIAPLESLDN